jgi:mannitol/fructose-specific phosphotransferase system IIA component
MMPVLQAENIILNVEVHTKEEAIKLAGQVLVQKGYVNEKYIDFMLAREEDMSTYVGNHLAVPHGIRGSEAEIKTSGISIIQIPKGVSFGEDMTAYVVIGIAGKDGEHLDIISSIAIICSEKENVGKLRKARTQEEVLHIFAEFQEG